ncbi:hypothetical protein [Loigolactobacillus bifermentans]|uniref:Uncharacterized protein n=1 Tax=Loigolactobacillus bifermentans DSM 20003 TaxID=1423726 RepID=A0A0R1H035_9LACO|nr:hypothetical protein [Loigolactobacillus bifermentans]KRK39775.1 hypothetical protein FC07_GL002268 [Loigolactobacillus bifermentans DSM 20003]QGG60955.1 hypothetical protein LB003_11030 [Loigolactobacillus bifermentans]
MTTVSLNKQYLQCVAFVMARLQTFDQSFRDYELKHYQMVQQQTDSQANWERSRQNYLQLVTRFETLDCPACYATVHAALTTALTEYATVTAELMQVVTTPQQTTYQAIGQRRQEILQSILALVSQNPAVASAS